MKFVTVLAAAAVVATGTGATPLSPRSFGLGWSVKQATGWDLSQSNKYGSPIPPWQPGYQPGWYYGNSPEKYPGIPCLSGIICEILKFFPYAIQCPKPPPHKPPHTTSTHKTTSTTIKTTSTTPTPTTTTPIITPTPTPTPVDGYLPTFSNITAAVQADDFMTFGLVDTVADCMAMCDSVAGCGFINSYDDVNGKGGSTQLTCSLFTNCHNATDADNRGGQSQPNGSVDFIINSDGWCKVIPS